MESNSPLSNPTRRDALTTAGTAALAATALNALNYGGVHAAGSEVINVALVGCGGRGTGAAENALNTKSGPIKLVAMADVFANKLKDSHAALVKKGPELVQVPEDRKFLGFEAYKQAMDALKPGDVVILATPPAFRWLHFSYAIQKGLHVFMEKPVTVDGPTSRRMFKLGEESVAKGLKVAVGLMCRHCVAREELRNRIKGGEIGEILCMRAYRMAGPTASAFSLPKPADMSETMYQISRFHSFLWASGGAFSDFLIHNIDECCWMKDAWPVKARASGGRHYRGKYIDQNFDTYSVEYTFGDGTKLFLEGRTMVGALQEFASWAHGSKSLAKISSEGHSPATPRIFKGHRPLDTEIAWKWDKPEPNPYQTEWDRLIEDIRMNKPHNEVKRGVEASLVTVMGRFAAHTGQEITYDYMLNHDHEFAPELAKMTPDGPAPVQAKKDGTYPIPQPGILKKREF
jgi:predicted dehydrogenase